MACRGSVALFFMKSLASETSSDADGLRSEVETVAHPIAGPKAQEGLAAFGQHREPELPGDWNDWRS